MRLTSLKLSATTYTVSEKIFTPDLRAYLGKRKEIELKLNPELPIRRSPVAPVVSGQHSGLGDNRQNRPGDHIPVLTK